MVTIKKAVTDSTVLWPCHPSERVFPEFTEMKASFAFACLWYWPDKVLTNSKNPPSTAQSLQFLWQAFLQRLLKASDGCLRCWWSALGKSPEIIETIWLWTFKIWQLEYCCCLKRCRVSVWRHVKAVIIVYYRCERFAEPWGWQVQPSQEPTEHLS